MNLHKTPDPGGQMPGAPISAAIAADEMRARARAALNKIPRRQILDEVSSIEILAWDIAETYRCADTDSAFWSKLTELGWSEKQLKKYAASAAQRATEILIQEPCFFAYSEGKA